jgi:hypothetical protein
VFEGSNPFRDDLLSLPPPLAFFGEKVGRRKPNSGDNLLSRATGETLQKHAAIITGVNTEARLPVIMPRALSGIAFAGFFDCVEKRQETL